MKYDQIISVIRSLAASQGFYGRLLRTIQEIEKNDAEQFLQLVEVLEKQNFTDPVDVIFYFES